MKKFFISILTLSTFAVFTSCGDDDIPTLQDQPIVTDGEITSQNDLDLDPLNLQGDILADITLSNNQTWNLTGELAVKNGFTLTIEAGTRIEATVGGTNVFVVVEQGAQIIADGTASDPIRFTSAAGNPRAGDWGGLLINGFAGISGGGTSTTEVLPLTYGGADDTDNSGILNYVIIEFTGARISGEREFNGLTLYAVGSGTQLSNIVINAGDDDGIEFFGGTASIDNLLVVDSRDDLFDWTQGYRGDSNSNWYGVRTINFTAISEDPRGIEGDGNLDGRSPGDDNQSNPTIENVTILNNGIIQMADMVKIRRGSNANITGLYLAFNGNNNGDADPSASDTIDLQDGRGNANSLASITGTINITSGVDIDDVKNTDPAAIVNVSDGVVPSVDANIFAWSGLVGNILEQ